MSFQARFTSLKAKMIVLTCAFALVASAIVVWLSHSKSEEVFSLKDLKSQLSLETQTIFSRLEQDFLDLVEDAYILSNTTSTQAIVDIKTQVPTAESIELADAARVRLTTIFTTFMHIRPGYTQIRFVGYADNGREIVRVNRVGSRVVIVNDPSLQEKGDEPYMQMAKTLAPGESRFSDISYNRENGQITPEKEPTIRLVTPIFTKDGIPFGAIVINANYETLLKDSITSIAPKSDTIILNQSGDVLDYHADNKQLNFYMAEDITEQFEQIRNIWSHEKNGNIHQIGNRYFYGRQMSDFHAAKGLELSILLNFPKAAISRSANANILIALLIMGACLAFAIFYARNMTKPLQIMSRRLKRIRNYSELNKIDLPVDALDEIGEVARAFTDLAQQLKEHQARTEKIVNNVVDGIIVIDDRGTINSFNPACEKLFGYSAEEVIGKPVTMLMPASNARTHHIHLANYARTGGTRVIGRGRELKAVRKDGEEFIFDISVSDFQEGGRDYFCGILRDLTETLRSKNALKREKETLQFALDSGELGRWDFDLELDHFSISDRCGDFIGRNASDFTNNRELWETIIHPDDLAHIQEHMRNIIAEKIDRYTIEFRVMHKDGHWVWLQSKGKVFEYNDNGHPSRLVGLHLDITERKRLDIIKDEFVSTVNHELRTPLTSIYGSLDLLNHLAAGKLDDQCQRLITLAHDACGRLTGLVDDILDLEKIAAGKLDYHIEPRKLSQLVDDCMHRNEVLANRFALQFITRHGVEDVVVAVDENRFCQVMVNLLSNACKFSPKGGDVIVYTERVDEHTVRIAVEDHGSGIPEAFQSRIFERFAQADSSSTRKVAGTGLGLSISKSIVEAFSGTIAFTTQEGEGTTFYFDLPVLEETTEALKADAA